MYRCPLARCDGLPKSRNAEAALFAGLLAFLRDHLRIDQHDAIRLRPLFPYL